VSETQAHKPAVAKRQLPCSLLLPHWQVLRYHFQFHLTTLDKRIESALFPKTATSLLAGQKQIT
jgi:hypothetical protein